MRFANRFLTVPAALLLCMGCSKSDDSTVDVPPPAPAPAAQAPLEVKAEAPAVAAPPDAAPPPDLATAPAPNAAPPAAEPTEFKDIDGKTISLLEYIESLASGYERIRASQTDGTPWPPLTSLDQLVTYRMVARLPAAPAGQKFVYDSQTGKVSLAAK